MLLKSTGLISDYTRTVLAASKLARQATLQKSDGAP
jgi:hypothetical protein